MHHLEKPLVSVVIPSYNHAKYIGKAIDSILNQTIENVELIIVDDESKDNSIQVIKDKISQYPDRNIIFIHRENRGICRTLNEGLKLAQGKYFSYIGSDDFWDSCKLEEQINAIEQKGGNFAASFTDCYIVDAEDKIIGRYGLQYSFRGGDIYEDLVWRKFHPTSPTTLFLRKAILSVGGFNEAQFIEDGDLWLRIAKLYKVAYVDEPLAYFRIHGKNTSTTNLEKMYKYYLEILEANTKTDPSLNISKYFLKAKIDAFQAGNYYEHLQLGNARKFAVKALLKNPFASLAWRTFILSFLGKKYISRIRSKKRANLVGGVQNN